MNTQLIVNETKVKKDKVKIELNAFNNLPVITLHKKEDGKRAAISFSPAAMGILGLRDKPRIVFFPSYNVSSTEETRKEPVFFSTDKTKVTVDKVYKTYQVDANTQRMHAKEIYEALILEFDLDENVDNHLILKTTPERTEGAIAFAKFEEPILDKGETVDIQMEQQVNN